MASAAAKAQSFVALHDKPLTVGVAIGCWCPTMDLLALVTKDGHLVVYRLNWQKLWLACPAVAITSMFWKPDGREHTHDASVYCHPGVPG